MKRINLYEISLSRSSQMYFSQLSFTRRNPNAGNKLVKDVITPQSDLLGKISNELDRDIVGTGNWRNLAYKLGIPREVYEEFSDPKGQDKPSPTIGIIQKVVKERPSITIVDVVKVLTRIKRMDVKEEIENEVGKCKF